MGTDGFGGGLWILVVINSVIFIAFAASFFHPHSPRDWRVMGAYSAFIVALFTEMYGFPLTIYVRYPAGLGPASRGWSRPIPVGTRTTRPGRLGSYHA